MLDSLGTFLFLIALVVLFMIVSFVYLIIIIILKVIDGEKRKANEQLVLSKADIIYQCMEEKKIESVEELLKCVTLPKKMTLVKEDNHFFIKYENLIYNVSTGRFKLENI